MDKLSLLAFEASELKEKMAEIKLKPYVAAQVLDWVYKKQCRSFDEMSNISKADREVLKTTFSILPFHSWKTLESKEEKAIKYVIDLSDGLQIECVVLKEKKYNTLCISSQVGCPVDCKFCLTGVMGFKRQLTVEEIVGQLVLADFEGHAIANIVFMGMGEPMLNFEAVFKAIEIFNDPKCKELGRRRITLSTSGYLPGIKRLIKEEKFINLAFSVGHPNPAKRQEIMPIEARYPIMEVLEQLYAYQTMHNRKLTLEYTLLEGVNDTEEAIVELGNIAKYLKAKVNLINLNPHKKLPFVPISVKLLLKLRDVLKGMGVLVTIRYRKGQDIAAACGQLGLV